jgi:hypothetical protein
MTDPSSHLEADVARFIDDQIDSVPHLESLLLLWESRPEEWDGERLASRIYVRPDVARQILLDLQRRRLVRSSGHPSRFAYDEAWDPDGDLMARAAEAYRRHLVPVAQRIHSKASGAVRAFARAFEFDGER